ncbi:hypothetical protein [Mycobacterium tuberculosis]|uniref:hypothetical protein n=1 Tax=Mycobacterium tuberculosis TaxID=1773 RepID=UPI00272B9C4B|nr:hypothetical protein [Mycobacterium tuberculosis]
MQFNMDETGAVTPLPAPAAQVCAQYAEFFQQTTARAKAMTKLEPIQIRPAQASDIAQIVQVHLQAFPGFFLTLMGPRFLRLLYSGFLNHPKCARSMPNFFNKLLQGQKP